MKILTNKEYNNDIKKAFNEGYNEGYLSKVSEEIEEANTTVLFDFYNPDVIVYGVERIPRQLSTTNIEHTLISYMSKAGIRSTWHAYCSLQMHKELVIQFADYLNDRKTKKIKSKK
jgi:hypothetical protein